MKKEPTNIVKLNNEYFEKKYVGDLKLTLDFFRKHLLIIGATGAGKSVMIKRIMRDVIKKQKKLENPSSEDIQWRKLQGQLGSQFSEDQLWEKYKAKQTDLRSKKKMIVHDIKGDFIREFYTGDDEWVILNPYDQRGYGFEVIELISLTTDIDRVVASIIPRPPEEKDPVWTNVPRSILRAVIKLCLKRNEFLNSDILKYINMGYKKFVYEISEREDFIDDNGKEKFRRVALTGMEDAFATLTSSETQAGNFWSAFTDATQFFRSFASTERTVNARDFVRSDPRNLILANFTEVQEKIAPLLSLFVDCVSSEILALKENDEYEVYLFLDEFNSLEKMPKILELLKLARSKGGIVLIGVQEIPPIEEKYGKAAVSTVKNNTRTKLIFNINDDETQKMAVALIGKQTMVYSTESNSGGETETKDGFSTSEQRQTKETILDSSVGALKDHQFYFIQAGVSDAKKKYVGKITGMIDPEVDFREEIAETVIWNEDLQVKNVRDHLSRKKESIAIPTQEEIKEAKEKRAIEDEKKAKENRALIEHLKRERAKKQTALGGAIAAAAATTVAAQEPAEEVEEVKTEEVEEVKTEEVEEVVIADSPFSESETYEPESTEFEDEEEPAEVEFEDEEEEEFDL